MASKPGKPDTQSSEAIQQNVKQNSGQGISGTAADPNAGQDDSSSRATGHGGKVENDVNQTGDQKPTQKNEGKRTANSRHDRESHVGSSNQLQARRGATGH